MTAGLAAVLVLCAHELGILLRREKMSARDEFIAWMLGTFPLLVIGAVAIVREVYVQNLAAPDNPGLSSLGPVAGTAIFITINLVIYFGATVVSYLHHDPAGAMVERLAKDLLRAERRVKKLERELSRMRLPIRRRLLARMSSPATLEVGSSNGTRTLQATTVSTPH